MVIDSRDQNSTRRVHQAAYERHTGDKGGWKLQVRGVLALEQSLRDPPGAAAGLRPALRPALGPTAEPFVSSSRPRGDGGRKEPVTRKTQPASDPF